jgi:hypothetical protein
MSVIEVESKENEENKKEESKKKLYSYLICLPYGIYMCLNRKVIQIIMDI